MATRKRRASPALPMMLFNLSVASWGTILHRSLMMAQGQCGPLEYSRMVTEKMAAMQLSTMAVLTGGDGAAALRPFLSRATANHRRLKRRLKSD